MVSRPAVHSPQMHHISDRGPASHEIIGCDFQSKALTAWPEFNDRQQGTAAGPQLPLVGGAGPAVGGRATGPAAEVDLLQDDRALADSAACAAAGLARRAPASGCGYAAAVGARVRRRGPAAEIVRRRWLTELLARSQAPSGTATFIARHIGWQDPWLTKGLQPRGPPQAHRGQARHRQSRDRRRPIASTRPTGPRDQPSHPLPPPARGLHAGVPR